MTCCKPCCVISLPEACNCVGFYANDFTLEEPFRVELKLASSAIGKPVYRVVIPNFQFAHNRSGDYHAFSADSAHLSLYDGTDWWSLEIANSQFRQQVPRENNGSVTEELMWAPGGSDYWYLNGNNLFRNDINGAQVAHLPLPSAIYGPSAGPAVAVQWRAGYCAPDTIQFIWGFHATHGTFILPFDATTGVELNAGWWISDASAASGDGTDTMRNGVCYNSGFMFSLQDTLADPDAAAFERFINYDGTGYTIIEPANPGGSAAWSHPTGLSTSNDLTAANPFFGDIIHVGGTCPDVTQAELKTITGRTGTGEFPNWYHGTMTPDVTVFSTTYLGPGSVALFDGIYRYNRNTCTINLIQKAFDEAIDGGFNQEPRPTLSPDGQWVAWHEKTNELYLTEVF